MLSLDCVNVRYGKNHVLKDLSVRVGKGEVISLIGANAAGKTTTLRTALGLKETFSGALRFAGEDITRLATHERVSRGLVLVPEGRQVFTKFTVVENLLMGAYHRADRDAAGKELEYVFDLFPRLRERRTQKAGSMSGGEQQMLAIARGLMAKPRCLLLDEPTLGLAPIIVEEIANTVGKLAAGGILHAATDWPDYAEQMSAVFAAEPLLEATERGFAERPVTKFESRGQRLGHPIRDLYFRRQKAPAAR